MNMPNNNGANNGQNTLDFLSVSLRFVFEFLIFYVVCWKLKAGVIIGG